MEILDGPDKIQDGPYTRVKTDLRILQTICTMLLGNEMQLEVGLKIQEFTQYSRVLFRGEGLA
jgi:hypothetical protein